MSKTVNLGELCDFINGGAWSDKEYVNAGLPVLKVSNFKPSGFVLDEVSRLPLSSFEKYKKNLLISGDLVIATVGSHPNLVNSAAGRSCVITDDVAGYLLNQNAVCVRTLNPNDLDQRYLTYLGKTSDFQHYIQSRGRGAANQMRIAISAIKEYEFNLPDIEIQCVIANTLSPYDDLIENSQRQIRLLEESAMKLFKEWFVNLRFPGHENSSIVNGIPDGWKVGTLSDLASFKRGKTITKDKVDFGLIPVVAGGLEPGYYHNKANAFPPLITISGSGANAGFTKLYLESVWASDCSVLDILETDNIYFIYSFLANSKNEIKNLQRGAAQPHVYPKDINSLKLLVPTEQMIQMYCDFASDHFNKIANLQKIIKIAANARDKLLPKLMSGEIEMKSMEGEVS